MTYKDIIQRIGTVRLRKNLSGRELSGRIGMSANYINRLESIMFKVPLEVLLDILLVCETSAEEFFYEKMEDYSADKQLLDKIKKLNVQQKQLLFSLLDTFK